MNDLQTIARPYAKAFFELALKHQALEEWRDALHVLKMTIEDRDMQFLLNHPEISAAKLVDLLGLVLDKTKISKSKLTMVQNAIHLMAEQHRLGLIPEVCHQYEQLKAEYTKTCAGIVFTSIHLDEKQMAKLANGLEKKLNRTVHLSQIVQPELLGGAKVQIGDMVIDGSIRGRLQRLSQSLSAAS